MRGATALKFGHSSCRHRKDVFEQWLLVTAAAFNATPDCAGLIFLDQSKLLVKEQVEGRSQSGGQKSAFTEIFSEFPQKMGMFSAAKVLFQYSYVSGVSASDAFVEKWVAKHLIKTNQIDRFESVTEYFRANPARAAQWGRRMTTSVRKFARHDTYLSVSTSRWPM